tara:strand:+ start:712 stop:894 length:183 start_codon:yes stop_codon:yes gene_type:complete
VHLDVALEFGRKQIFATAFDGTVDVLLIIARVQIYESSYTGIVFYNKWGLSSLWMLRLQM